MRLLREIESTLPLRWTTMRRLVVPLSVAAVLILLCGVVYWHIEPTATSLADGIWLAFVTAGTIGYGDIVPTSPEAKLFTVFVLLLGFGVLSLVTAAVAATWVEVHERQIEREILRDVHKQIAALRAEVQALNDAVHEERARR
jgi:voltage-gated potassium channel